MTEQQRLEAFAAAVKAAAARYGVEMTAVAQPEQLGAVIQVRAVIQARTVDGWQAPTDEVSDG